MWWYILRILGGSQVQDQSQLYDEILPQKAKQSRMKSKMKTKQNKNLPHSDDIILTTLRWENLTELVFEMIQKCTFRLFGVNGLPNNNSSFLLRI